MLKYPTFREYNLLGHAVANGSRHFITEWKVSDSIPDEVFGIFDWFNPFSLIISLGSTQPLIQMGTRNLPGDKGRPALVPDDLTAICEPII
jgi:hypothetical protein